MALERIRIADEALRERLRTGDGQHDQPGADQKDERHRQRERERRRAAALLEPSEQRRGQGGEEQSEAQRRQDRREPRDQEQPDADDDGRNEHREEVRVAPDPRRYERGLGPGSTAASRRFGVGVGGHVLSGVHVC